MDAAAAGSAYVITLCGISSAASKPVLVGYTLTNDRNKPINSVSPNGEFNIAITVKDIGLKTSDIKGASDIDFIKSVDSFSPVL